MNDNFITSSVPGRMRIRHPALRNERDALRLSNLLQAQSGILDITGNRRTGSLLVEYDSRATRPGDVLAVFGNWLARTGQSSAALPAKASMTNRRAAIRCLNRGMLATLTFSVIMSMMGRTKAHVVSGGLFTAGALIHTWLNRKTL
ncbi:MAG: cation transporter [Deltaproteobacteria bacterium]|nr:cation transporter [Deltaproteobacteria bacterium]